jgi:hypothetical protein
MPSAAMQTAIWHLVRTAFVTSAITEIMSDAFCHYFFLFFAAFFFLVVFFFDRLIIEP